MASACSLMTCSLMLRANVFHELQPIVGGVTDWTGRDVMAHMQEMKVQCLKYSVMALGCKIHIVWIVLKISEDISVANFLFFI